MKSSVKISVSLKYNKTILRDCFFTPPFKVANITGNKNGTLLELMLMCSSPGVLDNDEYCIEVNLRENTTLQIHTQSYQRLFQMKHGARQQMNVNLENGASLVYIPHPSVPHTSSIFTLRNNIHLSNGCRVIWGEVLTCGRQIGKEIFSFSKYHSITQFFLEGKLVVRENLLLQPSVNSVIEIGQMEGFTHQASLIFLSNDEFLQEKINTTLEFLSLQKEIEYGVSKTSVNGFIVRILGYKAEQLYNVLLKIGVILQQNKMPELVG